MAGASGDARGRLDCYRRPMSWSLAPAVRGGSVLSVVLLVAGVAGCSNTWEGRQIHMWCEHLDVTVGAYYKEVVELAERGEAGTLLETNWDSYRRDLAWQAEWITQATAEFRAFLEGQDKRSIRYESVQQLEDIAAEVQRQWSEPQPKINTKALRAAAQELGAQCEQAGTPMPHSTS